LPTTYNNVHECSTKFVLCTESIFCIASCIVYMSEINIFIVDSFTVLSPLTSLPNIQDILKMSQICPHKTYEFAIFSVCSSVVAVL
jgi:hypothetical protein